MSSSDIATATNTTKKVNRFYVRFVGMPSNISNIMGKNVKRVQRPNLTVLSQKIRQRGQHFNANMNIDYQPAQVTLHDDESSVVANMVYAQLFRQYKLLEDHTGQVSDEKADTFDVEVDVLNQLNEVVETFAYRHCRIVGISGSELETRDKETNSEIIMEFVFDKVDLSHYEGFLRQLEEYGD